MNGVQLALREPEQMSVAGQKARVLQMLREQDAVCSVEFLRARMPRFGGRLHELRRLGYLIETRRCMVASHKHETVQRCYALVGSPA